ncbi:FUSC family protein [Luteipulveratus flavus]|uniref:FUSC family protein n=1 Tax=Luteipulveratus flavus TaxID=3031728 RepID=A0ABT6C9V2_9MICO|nr:hypothetical protein [Luteipulveratus sp. YIM 133296]MDF8264834.1 hypothetical protein [Luteipulveratus sp. YIM 133296]
MSTGERVRSTSSRTRALLRTTGVTQHPMTALSLKSALAAGIAWQLGTLMPEPISHYPYYAPLGAFTVMYLTLSDSTKEALRTLTALMIGSAVALPVLLVWEPGALTVMLVVGVATALRSIPLIGDQSSWIPLAALFVLTASGADTEGFVAAYVVQVALGAAVGLAINSIVFPPLALHDLDRAVVDVRHRVAAQLEALADALARDSSPSAEEWRGLLGDLSAPRERLHYSADRSRRARRGNLRRRRWTEPQAKSLAAAAALERIAWLVEDVSITMMEFDRAENPSLDRRTAHLAAVGARSLAEVMTTTDDIGPHSRRVTEVEERVRALIEHVEDKAQPWEQRQHALDVAVNLQRAVRTFAAHRGAQA